MKTQDNDMPDVLVIDVDECASVGLEGLSKGQRLIVPRRAVRAFAYMGRHIPRSLWLPLCGRLMMK
jgi:short-subunit dehydrogenase